MGKHLEAVGESNPSGTAWHHFSVPKEPLGPHPGKAGYEIRGVATLGVDEVWSTVCWSQVWALLLTPGPSELECVWIKEDHQRFVAVRKSEQHWMALIWKIQDWRQGTPTFGNVCCMGLVLHFPQQLLGWDKSNHLNFQWNCQNSGVSTDSHWHNLRHCRFWCWLETAGPVAHSCDSCCNSAVDVLI